MILKFIILFSSILSSFLFLNIKMTITARAIAFGEYEKFGESKGTFIIMLISAICWSIYFTLY